MKAAELLLRQEMERAEAAYEDAKKMFAEQREILEGIDAEVVSVRSELSFARAEKEHWRRRAGGWKPEGEN